ncbi:hypothetical protein DEFFOIHO_00216 [Enterobacteria phage Cognac]|nr:hypothetical protein DEFFOIHO_00216 [Enterobacteria phage Cognac]QZI94077.1 hypothetical protein HFGIMCCB_00228 [Enterobacteria phage Whisky]
MSVFNREHVDIMNEPMFLGSGLGIARYDIQRHQVFEELIEKQLSFFGAPKKFHLQPTAFNILIWVTLKSVSLPKI